MTDGDALDIAAQEIGRYRLFSLDMDDAAIHRMMAPQGDDPSTGAAVAHLLGLDWLDPAGVEIFDVADLEELGLAGYLIQGNGVAADDVAADRARLTHITGWVVMVTSHAFGGRAARLHPDRRVSVIGIWQEDRPDIAFKPLPSDSAKGVITGPTPATSNPHLTVLWVVMALPLAVIAVGALAFVLFR